MSASAQKLKTPAFQLSPDPKFYYGSRSHNKAMAYMQFGVRQGEGFIVITGDVGAGKSLLVSRLLDQLDRNKVHAAQIVSSNLDARDLLRTILNAFQIKAPSHDKATQIDIFKRFLMQLHRAGKRVLLIVDEAQNLPKDAIEELRMLSNFCLDGKPLFQSFLVGQPQFKSMLCDPDLEQLRQRVIASHHLDPLDAAETKDYVLHRLKVAGWTGSPTFTANSLERIHTESGGVPRKINIICSRLLLLANLDKLVKIDSKTVDEVIGDLRREVAYGAENAKPSKEWRTSRRAKPQGFNTGDAKIWAAESYTAALSRLNVIDERLRSIEAAETVVHEKLLRKIEALEARLQSLTGSHVSNVGGGRDSLSSRRRGRD